VNARQSDPLVVNTSDDRCWRRRGWTPDGHGLYGLEGSPEDDQQTLYLIGDLAAFGLRSMSMAYAVPAPGGSVAPDGITRRIAPTQALREPEGEFHAFLHHAHKTPHDLPEMGGA
jgi:hypothetical protein